MEREFYLSLNENCHFQGGKHFYRRELHSYLCVKMQQLLIMFSPINLHILLLDMKVPFSSNSSGTVSMHKIMKPLSPKHEKIRVLRLAGGFFISDIMLISIDFSCQQYNSPILMLHKGNQYHCHESMGLILTMH